MKTLLILGSKPAPALPPASAYDALACANGSGYSAARLDLPEPVFTVMTSVLASGIESGRQSLQAITGLKTQTLYFLRRRVRTRKPLGRLLHNLRNFRRKRLYRMRPFYLKKILRSVDYTYGHFIDLDSHYYDGLVEKLCDHDPQILAQLQKKRPSTGLIALALGIEQQVFQRFIIAGFSFELTHPYASNPEIDERGTATSEHMATDIAVMRYLAQKFEVLTTEATVHENAAVPLLLNPDER